MIRSYTGHGIGKECTRTRPFPTGKRAGVPEGGTVLCVEPMIAMGTWRVRLLDDD
ncbi:MAG: hypothetical protein ACLS4Z_10440 [Christensenellaceae bacterium]